jgi:hypothetical protein
MSTKILESIPDWLSEAGFAKSDPVAELIIVISGQFEQTDLPYNGWFEVACIDCEQVAVSQGTITEFATSLREAGWCADNLERSTAICKICANQPDMSHYAAQYQEGSGGLL